MVDDGALLLSAAAVRLGSNGSACLLDRVRRLDRRRSSSRRVRCRAVDLPGGVACCDGRRGRLLFRRQQRRALILDDLFSELDPTIQTTLTGYLSTLPNQIFVTTTHWTEGFRPEATGGPEPALREIAAGRIL